MKKFESELTPSEQNELRGGIASINPAATAELDAGDCKLAGCSACKGGCAESCKDGCKNTSKSGTASLFSTTEALASPVESMAFSASPMESTAFSASSNVIGLLK